MRECEPGSLQSCKLANGSRQVASSLLITEISQGHLYSPNELIHSFITKLLFRCADKAVEIAGDEFWDSDEVAIEVCFFVSR